MKRNRIVFIVLLIVLAAIVLCGLTAFRDRSPGSQKVASRVYKNELSSQMTDEEIVQILVKRMMDNYRPGTIGWYEWVWTYEIRKINLPEGFPGTLNVDIYVKPFFPDAWRNIWTFEIDRFDGGWVRVGYYMAIDDKGNYYELSGPFSGG